MILHVCDAIWLLEFIKDWVLVESLDLSHNKIGYYAEKFQCHAFRKIKIIKIFLGFKILL